MNSEGLILEPRKARFLFVRRVVKLAFLVTLVVASSAAAERGPTTDPCFDWGPCQVCTPSNQDCFVVFCPWGMLTNCELN